VAREVEREMVAGALRGDLGVRSGANHAGSRCDCREDTSAKRCIHLPLARLETVHEVPPASSRRGVLPKGRRVCRRASLTCVKPLRSGFETYIQDSQRAALSRAVSRTGDERGMVRRLLTVYGIRLRTRAARKPVAASY
jgi:hypothetical protein